MYEFSGVLIVTMWMLGCIIVAVHEKSALPLLFFVIPLFVGWLFV